ncbi:hypothetical protein [Flavobacterium sp. SM2513]|uniref:hypothetical protein n=1 Tax=Flavobacterium sp. SM2513 TaxID=3424766 RepID=UPI003D7F8D81
MEDNTPLGSELVPDIGAFIARYFKEKRTYKSALARKLKVRPQTVLGYRQKKSMQTQTIWTLSLELKHNFMKDLADQLPKEFSTFSPKDTTLQDRIAALETENELLKAQLAVLKEVMGK